MYLMIFVLQEIFGNWIFRIIVTASCVQKNPPLLKLFRSYTLPVSEAENKAFGFDDPCKSLVWKCARYSR